jgi:hypothetical protein
MVRLEYMIVVQRQMNNFSVISWQKQTAFDEIHFVLDQHP